MYFVFSRLQWETRPEESATPPSADAQEALLPHRQRNQKGHRAGEAEPRHVRAQFSPLVSHMVDCGSSLCKLDVCFLNLTKLKWTWAQWKPLECKHGYLLWGNVTLLERKLLNAPPKHKDNSNILIMNDGGRVRPIKILWIRAGITFLAGLFFFPALMLISSI